ncbi:MAG: ATP synthase F1 subunit gamma [bacterium]|nr:ATP synthase F1 subunit gamma [bacterium]
MALKDIKSKIKATERTHKVTRAMEAVSAVKMRKTQGAAFAGRPYARAALAILARLSGSTNVSRHPLAQKRKVKRTAFVVITSDKGLAGALNSSVLKEALLRISSEGRVAEDFVIYAYGRKGEEFFRRRNYTIAKAVLNKRDDVALITMEELAREVAAGFTKGDFDEVIAIYSNFKSTFEQVPTMRTLLPLSLAELTKVVEDIAPEKGKFSEPRTIEASPAYEVEPSPEEVLNVLLPRLVAISLYHMLLEAKASEHSARMVAMKNASDKSKEVAHDLTRLYNKRRQAAITREVSEIVSGREALAM